jgi:hypothetical protein
MKHPARGLRGPLITLVAALMAVVMTAFVAGSPTTASAKGKGGSGVVASTDEGVMKAPIRYKSADGWFKGRFTPESFTIEDGTLMAHGVVSGLVHLKGERTQKVSEEVSLPVTGATAGSPLAAGGKMPSAGTGATCDILNLVLGPLDLNLLGLEIHLDTVVLDIIANPAGGLLGQLLCAVANLLSTGPLEGLLEQLIGLLEDILGALSLGG